MAALIQIPWQPHLWLTPHTLGYLKAASKRVGHNLYLYDNNWQTISPAWRSYEQQLTAYRKYLAGDGPPASNPDTGTRPHMRGAAFDLREQSTTVRNACKAVGLIPDSNEAWHWNDPSWFVMPIIPTNTALAGGGIVALTESDPFMPKVIKDTDTTKANNRYAVWDGGFTFDFITGNDEQIANRVARKKEIIGQKASVSLSGPAFAAELADVNANRAHAGLTEIVRPA